MQSSRVCIGCLRRIGWPLLSGTSCNSHCGGRGVGIRVCEEANDAIEVVEESFLVTGLDWVAEEVLAARVAECDELSVAVDALRADGPTLS